MQTEKFRYYSQQSILNILCPDANWHNLTFGSLACPNAGLVAWGQVLKERKSLFLKNQGLSNDNTTAGTVEIYFGPYHIDHIKRTITYSAVTGLYTLDVAPANPAFVPVSNVSYLVLHPFGMETYDVSGQQIVSAVMRNVVNVAGTIYTFNLDDIERISAALGTNMGAWALPAAGWDWNTTTANAWHHILDAGLTTLITNWNPTIGETYNIKITLTTTTPGTGIRLTCGSITSDNFIYSGTHTFSFTAESANALTIIPNAGGTWVGDVTAVSVKIDNKGVNDMLQKNIAQKKVDFYKYSVPALTTERGIILATGETYSADITQDVVLYYKGSVLNQTLVVQQFS